MRNKVSNRYFDKIGINFKYHRNTKCIFPNLTVIIFSILGLTLNFLLPEEYWQKQRLIPQNCCDIFLEKTTLCSVSSCWFLLIYSFSYLNQTDQNWCFMMRHFKFYRLGVCFRCVSHLLCGRGAFRSQVKKTWILQQFPQLLGCLCYCGNSWALYITSSY